MASLIATRTAGLKMIRPKQSLGKTRKTSELESFLSKLLDLNHSGRQLPGTLSHLAWQRRTMRADGGSVRLQLKTGLCYSQHERRRAWLNCAYNPDSASTMIVKTPVFPGSSHRPTVVTSLMELPTAAACKAASSCCDFAYLMWRQGVICRRELPTSRPAQHGFRTQVDSISLPASRLPGTTRSDEYFSSIFIQANR